MKKKTIIILLIMISTIIIIITINNRNRIKEYHNDTISFKYDLTWKLLSNKDNLELIHKKTKSKITFYKMNLEDRYIDVDLKDLVNDIIYGIEEQNKDYKQINKEEITNQDMDKFVYLYENGFEEIMINIYKKNTVIYIITYEAKSNYFDIVLDSVNSIFDSIEIDSKI